MNEKKNAIQTVKGFGSEHPIVTAVAVMIPVAGIVYGLGLLAGHLLAKIIPSGSVEIS